MSYNGYANYATWCAALWINEVEEWCEAVRYRATLYDASQLHEFADWLADLFDQCNPVAEDASVYTDLMAHILAQVDWHALAKMYHDET